MVTNSSINTKYGEKSFLLVTKGISHVMMNGPQNNEDYERCNILGMNRYHHW